MSELPILTVTFFRTGSSNEPVRDWLKGLSAEDRKIIGEDVKLTQFRWPLGMPLVRKMEPDLWEVRSRLAGGRISRVLFTVDGHEMVLLHGFEKKSRKTPKEDLDLARQRKRQWFEES
ncbi:MAG: type II toxin-antitoxin system RelE/ParE family toxin [Magnetococcales bacterium]|nr:type II toxin-antitoxin system RelE/ParE family toxin [Magnetococcales bacterium]